MKLKKVAALGLATAMAFSVTACSSSKPAETTAAAEEQRQQQQLTQQRLLKKQSKAKIRQKLKLVFPFTSSLITS